MRQRYFSGQVFLYVQTIIPHIFMHVVCQFNSINIITVVDAHYYIIEMYGTLFFMSSTRLYQIKKFYVSSQVYIH